MLTGNGLAYITNDHTEGTGCQSQETPPTRLAHHICLAHTRRGAPKLQACTSSVN